jgi:hypothetical protein
MVEVLPAPEVVRCYFDDAFGPHVPAMCLRWPDADGPAERVWELPEGVAITGPPPGCFGIHFHRQGDDSYDVRLLWDRTWLMWDALSREELLTSDLSPLLAALGTDLWYLLDQPISPEPPSPLRAA